MSRIEQINELLQKNIALFLSQELISGVLITITEVKASSDLKNADIFVSVLPDNKFGSTLSKLRKQSGQLNGFLKNKIKLRKIPKFSWVPDDTEKHAAVIEDIIRKDNY